MPKIWSIMMLCDKLCTGVLEINFILKKVLFIYE
jgi:hypothetical protein